MSRLILRFFVIFLWSGLVNSIMITNMNKRLLEKLMNKDLDAACSNSSGVGLIYPGTKWCGAGNIAKNYDDLGSERETDKCCRQHDFCPDYIESGDTKYGLTNPDFYTRLTCDCDEQFRTCLHKANKKSADEIGIIFFDGLKTKCFKKAHPIIGCAKKGGLLYKKCLKYCFDNNGKIKYQWFDVPDY